MGEFSTGMAERKQKQKLADDPNGISWRNNSNCIAEKMMSKMGWSDGYGLGRQLQGMIEPVKNSSKKDKRGFGCSVKQSIEGSVHTDDFDSLLSKLNENHGRKSDEVTQIAMSLTETSQKTSSRLHYSKFIKSKDVSKYSSNDLACIFAKSEPFEAKEKVIDKSAAVSDFGVNTTTSTMSLNDYFKMKMNKKLGSSVQENKTMEHCDDNTISVDDKSDPDRDTESDRKPIKKKKTKKRNRSPTVVTYVNDIIVDVVQEQSVSRNEEKKKKKLKKSKLLSLQSCQNANPSFISESSDVLKENFTEDSLVTPNELNDTSENTSKLPKSKKRKKHRVVEIENDADPIDLIPDSNESPILSVNINDSSVNCSHIQERLNSKTNIHSLNVNSEEKERLVVDAPGLKISQQLNDERKATYGVEIFPASNYYDIEGYVFY